MTKFLRMVAEGDHPYDDVMAAYWEDLRRLGMMKGKAAATPAAHFWDPREDAKCRKSGETQE